MKAPLSGALRVNTKKKDPMSFLKKPTENRCV